jgi:hypothetical protein
VTLKSEKGQKAARQGQLYLEAYLKKAKREHHNENVNIHNSEYSYRTTHKSLRPETQLP